MKINETENKMNELQDAFLACIKKHPGCRRRDLPHWGVDRVMSIDALYLLIESGKVRTVIHKDAANMEFYDKLYAN